MIEIIKAVMVSLLNVPYFYGGNNPLQGLDCSGGVQWVYRSVGVLPPGDFSAQGLFNLFERDGAWNVYRTGSMVFFGKSSTKITHVALLWDADHIFECGGGDSTTTTLKSAMERGACGRIRPLKNRSDIVAVIRPRLLP